MTFNRAFRLTALIVACATIPPVLALVQDAPFLPSGAWTHCQ